ncbi:hypothetical protein DINM_002472 [Dirofilaria immitis]|nr:hypothetical protein [Dirofilaria immitis]
MIDDQLNAEFGRGSTPIDIAVLENPSSNIVTPNTASQLSIPSNQIDTHPEHITDRSHRSYVVISRNGRENLNQSRRRISSQASAQSIPSTQIASSAESHQETSSVTAESSDSEDSEERTNRDSENNEAHCGSTTSTRTTVTSNATSTARPIQRNTRQT